MNRTQSFIIEEELKKLPDRPGVYIMHDAQDTIIYVGKAINLKNRVRQYFQSSRGKSPKIGQMVTKIHHFEYIVTASELEALVLECNLIKEHRPRYNTMLKDDKTYPFIRVTVGEAFPRIMFTRKLQKDKSRYFGPYTSAFAVRETIDLIRKLYRLRDCSRKLPQEMGLERPCLNYHIKQCNAPCQGWISEEDYARNVGKALDFLEGNYGPVLRMLEASMKSDAEEMRFEEAASWRDLLESARLLTQQQKVTRENEEDSDVLAVAMDGTDAIVQVFFVRGGKMIGREHFWIRTGIGDTPADILSGFIKQFYSGTPSVPRELMLQEDVEDHDLLEQWLSGRRGGRVYLRVPQRGSKEKLVEMAGENARITLSKDRERIRREEGRTIGAAIQPGIICRIGLFCEYMIPVVGSYKAQPILDYSAVNLDPNTQPQEDLIANLHMHPIVNGNFNGSVLEHGGEAMMKRMAENLTIGIRCTFRFNVSRSPSICNCVTDN